MSGSPDVTLSAAGTFANNDYIVIPQAGAACSISGTPSAPTAAALTVQGSLTLNYKVGRCGRARRLDRASSVGQITNAPAIFGNFAVVISSISVTADVVTVNFASPINASANQTSSHCGCRRFRFDWCGVWTIATRPLLHRSRSTLRRSGTERSVLQCHGPYQQIFNQSRRSAALRTVDHDHDRATSWLRCARNELIRTKISSLWIA